MRRQPAQDAVEYALLIATIVIVLLVGVALLWPVLHGSGWGPGW